jgi:hypothetical protein
MPLPWVRLDTNLPSHDKVLALLDEKPDGSGHRAAFAYVCSIAYCGQNGTDGLIPFRALMFVHARKRDAELLVKHMLWTPDPMGWRIPNYLERQQSQQDTESARAGKRLGALKANCVRWHGDDCNCWKEAATA